MTIQYRRDLWKLLINVKGDAAEIGVAEGYFSADMLSWLIDFPLVYLVDRWLSVPSQGGDASNLQEWHDKNLAAATKRVAEYGDRAVFLRGDSTDMASHVPNRSLALVYVDGDHSYEGVRADIAAWFPKVVPGGVMAFHDYENPAYGVRRAVDTFCGAIGGEIHLISEDKPEDAGAYFYL